MKKTPKPAWCDPILSTTEASDRSLTAITASEPHELAAFAASPMLRQSGVYIISNSNGQHYVGGSGNVHVRTAPYLHGVIKPARIIAIIGQGQALQECEAKSLERIIIQALWPKANFDANQVEAYGGRVNLEQYARLQAGWSSLTTALRLVQPDIARPWIGPEYCHLPPPSLEYFPLGGRRYAKRKGIQASIIPAGRGYILEAGSLMRCEPLSEDHLLSFTIRIESLFSGLVVHHDGALKLMRPVYRSTLAACSKFVFDTTDAAAWKTVEDDTDMPQAQF